MEIKLCGYYTYGHATRHYEDGSKIDELESGEFLGDFDIGTYKAYMSVLDE